MILNFAKNSKQKKWLDGCIVNKYSPLTYIIELIDGRLFKRHIDHIRLRSIEPNSPLKCTNIGTPLIGQS